MRNVQELGAYEASGKTRRARSNGAPETRPLLTGKSNFTFVLPFLGPKARTEATTKAEEICLQESMPSGEPMPFAETSLRKLILFRSLDTSNRHEAQGSSPISRNEPEHDGPYEPMNSLVQAGSLRR
jgi:hypothetical protein